MAVLPSPPPSERTVAAAANCCADGLPLDNLPATSVKDLIAAIGNFIDGWNDRCEPFVWTKTADELLPHCKPAEKTSFTKH